MRTYTDAYARLFIILSTAQLALCSGDTQAAASVDICAGAYVRMEYKPGLTGGVRQEQCNLYINLSDTRQGTFLSHQLFAR